MASLPREIVRWLQTLDLPQQVRHPRRDMANGYLAAEICARYWGNVDLHQYDNGTSTRVKESNWKALNKAMAKNNAGLPAGLVADVIAAKEDAGRQLLETLYAMFTNRVVQRAAPIEHAELQQLPTYVKTQHMTDAQMAQQQEHLRMQQQQQQQQQQEAEQAQMEREAAAEAERRRQQQKLNANQKKPKAPVKVQAIKAAEEADGDEDAPKLQFSGVTVKPLSSQALARLGVGRSAQRRPNSNQQSSSDAPRQSAGDGVLVNLSTAIENMLRDSTAPSWPVPPGMTYVDFFAQQHERLPPAIKDSVWSTLYASIDDTAAWLVARPGDIGSFTAAFLPAVSTEAVQSLLGRAHFAFTGLDGANSAAYVKCVFAAVAKRRLGYAVSSLQRSVFPLVVPSLAALARGGKVRRDDAVACVDALAALAGCGVEAPSVAEGRVRQFLTLAHQALVASAAPATGAAADAVDRYVAFLSVVDIVCGLPCSGVAAPRPAEAASASDDFDGAEPSERAGSLGQSDDVGASAAADAEDAAAPAAKLHPGVGTAVQYHAAAALHHASATARVMGLALLTRLAEGGMLHHVLPRHVGQLTALTDAASVERLAAHPDAIPQTLALLRACVRAAAHLRRLVDAEGADDAAADQEARDTLDAADYVEDVALHVSDAPDGPQSFFTRANTGNRLALVAEIGAAAAFMSEAPRADGAPAPQQLAVRNAVQMLLLLPPAQQLLITRGQDETVPAAPELSKTFGIVPARVVAPRSLHGAPDAWPPLSVISMVVQLLAGAELNVPALPTPAKGARIKASQSDAEDAAALESAGHFIELLFQFVVRRRGALCPAAYVATAWEVMRLAWPQLNKGFKYVEHLRFLRQKGVAMPSDAAAHAAMLVIARRSRAIIARFFAEWSGVPSARALAQPTIDRLAGGVHGDESVDDPAEGADRVNDWWTNAAAPQQYAATHVM
eukprot:CAMPEP_0174829460 /NCGR_PEP_ID=MMETSP1114-20130205/1938_1 /TAXON_ID=312471 /ORGANISM="Neobodo designis, Strain CCAP 1951/1" /LENGTH=952 /DNA_ID=CAMNT_0016063209 /DNA_START=37 /DNA_END=2896 /DNA_ORIENTATION=-